MLRRLLAAVLIAVCVAGMVGVAQGTPEPEGHFEGRWTCAYWWAEAWLHTIGWSGPAYLYCVYTIEWVP